RRPVGCTGIGLHCGRPVRLDLHPAPAGHGIVFRRTDVGVDVPARLSHLSSLDHATTLSADGVSIGTVEHLLSALFALGVDDVRVDLDGPEVPVMDGSAAPFVILLHEVGLRPLKTARQYLRLLRPVEVVRGAKWARLTPAEQFRVSYTIGFDHPLLREQKASLRVAADTFAEDIAPARTFGFLREVEALRKAGLALGGSLENAVVIGETGVLNQKLRFEDEFVRHKILDAIGDLALLGHPVLAHLEAHRAGHALHAALAQKLMATPEAWELVAHPALSMPAGPGSPAPALRPAEA
ncbi:MAG TPA: UDP-3-O-acyl-N-acetylglucosamine deacetylase, partial [Vicinamibacteria bacterium]|nr:UDP-3-O-acyl-N-acetylglucosamine deacetylase [Vicinamibacteria bacterium]